MSGAHQLNMQNQISRYERFATPFQFEPVYSIKIKWWCFDDSSFTDIMHSPKDLNTVDITLVHEFFSRHSRFFQCSALAHKQICKLMCVL